MEMQVSEEQIHQCVCVCVPEARMLEEFSSQVLLLSRAIVCKIRLQKRKKVEQRKHCLRQQT